MARRGWWRPLYNHIDNWKRQVDFYLNYSDLYHTKLKLNTCIGRLPVKLQRLASIEM